MAKELTEAEIGNIGERCVTAWLQAKGSSCYRNTQQPGFTDIEATIKDEHGKVTKGLLVQVKTAVTPNSPRGLNAEEKKGIVDRAKRKGYEAWLAQVSLDQQGNQLGEIKWTELK